MAASTNWHGNDFGKSRNPCSNRNQLENNRWSDNQQSQISQFSPKIPCQQQAFQPFNPVFAPQETLPNSQRPFVGSGSTLNQNRYQNTQPQQQEHVHGKFKDDVWWSKFDSQNPAFTHSSFPARVGRYDPNFQFGQRTDICSQVSNDNFNTLQHVQSSVPCNEQNARNVPGSQQNINSIQCVNMQITAVGDHQAADDQRWLQDWLKHRHHKIEGKPKKTLMKIGETQEKTRQMIVLLARLQKNKQILETLQHEDKSIWEQKLKEVLTIKAELESVQKELTSEENIRSLQANVSQRKKKRERIKQRKKEEYLLYQEEMANREHKHAEIDKAMQQLTEKQKLEKQEKDMQKEADEILSQVRKKLAEANKSVQVIESLQKLRKLRTDRLERQGVLSMYESQGGGSTNRLMFEAKLSNLRELLNEQLEIYKSEEAALKVHLETEQEETREKEREKTRLKMIQRQRQEWKKEEKMLFGDQKDPVPGDPLYPFRQYYDAASNSLEALIAIRREWDGYLTTPEMGSCIPDSWVIPVEPNCMGAWVTALQNGQPT